MKNENSKENEILRIQSLMEIKSINREYFIEQMNILISNLSSKDIKWKLKLRIISYVAILIIGKRNDKDEAAKRLQVILEANPELSKHYLNVSSVLKIAARA
ncbi:hypothetical protein FNJ87_01585 [Nonlabens mediterrranea]|uniref:Tetratricopeptide repeat protein n=1 Tax=Nonlabens mediterrranea TaxID=1419947 RepID=A0ABS0A3B4_9FLAO|nr:hypothetical protein [Nonlabens mediterrranea]